MECILYRNMMTFDPTFFLSITYCLLFGIMFGDMGQGIVLMILGFVFEKKGKLFGIIGRAGITSTIFGFLFGSLFGNEEILNPIHQSLFHVREKLFDVMSNSNTMTLLLGAMLIGAVLILMSMSLNIMNNVKHKKWGEVFFTEWYCRFLLLLICTACCRWCISWRWFSAVKSCMHGNLCGCTCNMLLDERTIYKSC